MPRLGSPAELEELRKSVMDLERRVKELEARRAAEGEE